MFWEKVTRKIPDSSQNKCNDEFLLSNKNVSGNEVSTKLSNPDNQRGKDGSDSQVPSKNGNKSDKGRHELSDKKTIDYNEREN